MREKIFVSSLILGLVLVSGMACDSAFPGSGSKSASSRGYGYGSGGGSSRTYVPADKYAVASVRPNLSMYPEFAVADRDEQAYSDTPKLQPLPQLQSGMPSGFRPVSAVTGVDGVDGPKLTPGLAPAGMQPIKQLIYGGSHPDHDAPDTFKLRHKDKIKVLVKEHPEFSGILEIAQDGMIQIPNTEDLIRAEGKSVDQIREALVERIAPYIQDKPRIEVNIDYAAGGYYYIYGEVANQGRFPLGIQPIRLSEAVFRANSTRLQAAAEESREERLRTETEVGARESFSISKYAKLDTVSVIIPHRSRPCRKVFNVKTAMFQGMTGNDPVVRPGQIIWVPSSFDKRLIEFAKRVIAPIQVLGDLDEEASTWYGRATGNTIKGRRPAVYELKESESSYY
ncbi:MAG: polysaccharide biosynthesis/export family protein [Planctomycetes bacterium]|nr:polysaccharide biosynthesis/export family protein [Planctomycetota bacterium]